MNDKPIDVYNKLKDKYDVIFTFMPSQFYVTFWSIIDHFNTATAATTTFQNGQG